MSSPGIARFIREFSAPSNGLRRAACGVLAKRPETALRSLRVANRHPNKNV
jgi:hypothetical protein